MHVGLSVGLVVANGKAGKKVWICASSSLVGLAVGCLVELVRLCLTLVGPEIQIIVCGGGG